MLHPSYTDLMKVVNSNVEEGEEPVVNSRYSIVLATAKRARQIIAGEEPLVSGHNKKPLSAAIDELYSGKIKILNDEDDEIVQQVQAQQETDEEENEKEDIENNSNEADE